MDKFLTDILYGSHHVFDKHSVGRSRTKAADNRVGFFQWSLALLLITGVTFFHLAFILVDSLVAHTVLFQYRLGQMLVEFAGYRLTRTRIADGEHTVVQSALLARFEIEVIPSAGHQRAQQCR